MQHFMIVLLPNINLLNLSWIKNCLFFKEYGAFNDERFSHRLINDIISFEQPGPNIPI